MTAKEATDKNIITKQVVINTSTSALLLPITADEKVINEIQQALTELEELKKRDTAMKPILIHYNSQHYNCPMCNETISIENSKLFNRTFNKYCKYCGQKLDWSDKDE